jgi:hypothetical protein
MSTITPRPAISTIAVVQQLSAQHLSVHAALGSSASPAGAALLVLAVLLVAALSSAARGLATLLAELLRVAAAMASILLTIAIVTVLAVAFLMHA